MTKRLLVVFSLLIVAGMVISGPVAAADQIIKIATQSPLSGDQSVVGVDIKRGAEMALEQMSAPLTKMGFKVELAAIR